MSLVNDLLEKAPNLTIASRYTAMNGVLYFGTGALFIAWPEAVQIIFRDAAFAGREESLMRVVGMTLLVLGWLYVFGGRSGARQTVAASVIERLVFVPAVAVPLAMAGVFPHLLVTFAILDPSLAIIAWILLGRKTSRSDSPALRESPL
ncbi:MAG TPA: hypothetical protein VH351_16240 [Bryobacteraceae bacterium]|jgi:hypothetical protein|nr:hypothetical protein [Bryobacteraceae bacterium]